MMKLWALVGLFTVASAPWAVAAVDPDRCQAERETPRERIASSARVVDGDRNGGGGLTAARESARAADAEARETQAAIDERRARLPEPRKRIDARVPDAVLIGRGGAL